MKTFNLNSDEWDGTRDREDWRARGALVGQRIGGSTGRDDVRGRARRKLWPYHTHHLNEECFLVLARVRSRG